MTTADTVCYIAQPIYTLLFNAFLFSTGTLDSGDLFHVTVKEVNIVLACIFFLGLLIAISFVFCSSFE